MDTRNVSRGILRKLLHPAVDGSVTPVRQLEWSQRDAGGDVLETVRTTGIRVDPQWVA